MTTLLIVNDDGAGSPMLAPLAEKLSVLGRVRIVVPATEQSWQGKAVTRFGKLWAEPLPHLGAEAFSVSGTPSDCVNLAVHNLFPDPPDWIVSGVNLGTNAGTGFIINSGTVGAALEGALQGIPAVAFSTFLDPRFFREWMEHRRLTDPESLQVVDSTTTRTATMMESIMAHGLPPGAMVLNINFPGTVNGSTPVRWVPAQNHRYGGLFLSDGDGFVRNPRIDLYEEEEGHNDRSVILAGEISVSALSLAGLTLNGVNPFPL